jgi:TDG/mug DNA glycosylase family protein
MRSPATTLRGFGRRPRVVGARYRRRTVDERTVDTYERDAAGYAARRRADDPERAAAFAARLAPGGVRVDLGCGPGHYLPDLGQPVVALDAAVAMVAEARRRHPGTPGLACDVEALAFRRGSLAGVWASKCLQHVPAERLPMVLTGLHRALVPGGRLDVTLFDDTDQGRRVMVTGGDDEFPGRLFSFWEPEALGRLLVGAGFTIDDLAARDPTGGGAIRRVVARATRARTLPDTVGPAMRLLMCGLNPSLYAADAGVGFARPGNRFWPAALAAGIVSVDRDPDHALRHHRVGMTDLVKRATVGAAELTRDEYRVGLARVESLAAWLRPRAVCFVGLAGWRAAVDRAAEPGVQPRTLGGAPVYLMPSTSGLNAHSRPADLADHLRAAATLADG